MPKHRKKDSKKAPASMPLRIRKHLKALDMDKRAYVDWCWNNGFIGTIDKTPAETEAEAAFYQNWLNRFQDLDRALKNPQKLIKDACADKIAIHELTRLKWAEFCRVVQQSNPNEKKRKGLEELLLRVEKRADFLFERVTIGHHTYQYVDALIQLNYRRGQWIRPLQDWKPRSRNRRRQFSSLLRHLLSRYPVPVFFDSAWIKGQDGARKHRDWFIHIGDGYNIRHVKTPFPLSKRMAHCFLEAPENYSIEQALRWGQVTGLGGDRRLTEALLGTQIGDQFEHHEFWQTVIMFFINNPLLDRRHTGPIIDYLHFQKFAVQEVMVGPNQMEYIQPPQPNLTMRGRRPEALLRQVEEWHRELNQSQSIYGLQFKPSGFKPFSSKTGAGGKGRWIIRELLSGSDLVKEGKALNHCVATYAESCARGTCSIWTMERSSPLTGTDKYLTIEVLHHGAIVQIRGKHNRLPTDAEIEVVKKWAAKADLAVSQYIEVMG